MADSELSLLWKLRADTSQGKTATAEARVAVAQLRQSFGPELTQSVNVANKAFSDIGANVQNFVAQRVPLLGGAIVRVTDGLRAFSAEGVKNEKAIAGAAASIEKIAIQSRRSVPEVTAFLGRLAQLEGTAKRDAAAVEFLGASLATKLTPELAKARVALAAASAESAAAGSAIAGMAGPIGIAVLALAALAAGVAIVAREIFDLTKQAAAFQGKLADLSQQTNVSVEILSAMEVAIRQNGGEISSVVQALTQFQRKLNEAQDPLSKTADLFRKFNIDISDTETALRSAFSSLAAMPEGFAQTSAAAELFGARGGKQVLLILKQMNGDLDGAIKRLREAGILISEDAARAADKFNDDLELLQFQLRALTAVAAEDLIPIIAEAIRAFTDLAKAIRPVVSILGSFTAVAIRPVGASLRGLSLVVQALTGDYKGLAKAIKESKDAQNIPVQDVPGVTPVPLPQPATPRQAATEAANQAEAVVAAVKRRVAETNQALDSLFQQGRRNIEQRADEIIAGNNKILNAERDRIDADIALKQQEIKALDEAQEKRGEIIRRDTDDYRALTKEVEKLQQERLDKESRFNVESAAIRLKAATDRANATRNQIQNETDLLVKEIERQVQTIEAQIKLGITAEESSLTTIEQLEQLKIDERIRGLERQKQVGFLTIEEQKNVNDEIQKLNQERDRLGDDQAARRLERERAAAARTRDILIANIDTLLQLEQIAGQRRIDAIQALADARVIAEEEAARQILQIRLDLIDSEIEATKEKLKAAATITDKDERIRAQAEINNQLRLLNAERAAIQDQGNREIDDGRQKDLDNARRYADDLQDIQERIADVEREAAEEVIRLMGIGFASRRDIIRARLQADIEDENARHRNALQGISALRQENAESKRTREEKLQIEKEINALEEAEAERHRLALKGIREQGKQDEQEAEPLGRLELDLTNLREFASILEDSIVPLGEILTGTFRQVADAIGQTVANWVLLGETGPAVMRKILAQALASIAAEAAVNAVKELALGFATLFLNPAESASHFTAAAIWGSIGGVAAVAGRGVAGDLFKPKTGASGPGGRESSPQGLQTIVQGRNQVQVVRHEHVLKIQSNDSHIVKVIGKNMREGGELRELVLSDDSGAV